MIKTYEQFISKYRSAEEYVFIQELGNPTISFSDLSPMIPGWFKRACGEGEVFSQKVRDALFTHSFYVFPDIPVDMVRGGYDLFKPSCSALVLLRDELIRCDINETTYQNIYGRQIFSCGPYHDLSQIILSVINEMDLCEKGVALAK